MPDEECLEKALGEFYDRAGEASDLTELIRKHPDLEEEIRAHFELLAMVDRGFDAERSQDTASPERIGDYRIVREIGRGGMGVVYEAEQTSMGRRVALKVLSPSVTSAAQAIQRFEREARAAGKLRHQNIAPVFAMGEDRGLHYYAMELVEGRSLGEVISEQKAEADEVPRKGGPFGTTTQGREHFVRLAEAIAGVAEALHAAHEEGVVHRDVKPTNLLLAPDGTLKLVDFGLARLAGEGASMTVTGQILGTPHYMSPEQAMAREIPIDFRTDIYSLGATLYEALTLTTPFTGDSLPAVCSAILHKEPSLPRKANPRIPRDLETIVLKAMEKDRERRYASAEEMAKDLRRFAVGMPIRARRIGPVKRTWRKVKRNKIRTGLVAAVVVLAAVGVFLAQRSASESAQRKSSDYERLLARAEDAMARESAPGGIGSEMPRAESAADLLSRAIVLLPDRAEGYWLRALASGRTLDERLDDVVQAEERGLARGTAHMLRACFFRLAGRLEEAEEEMELASEHEDGSALGLLAKARLLASEHRRPEAIEAATQALAHPGLGPAVRAHALRIRSRLSLATEDWPGAHDDLTALKTLGDDSIETRVRIASLWKCLGRGDVGDGHFEKMLHEAEAGGGPVHWKQFCWACANASETGWFHRATEKAFEQYEHDLGVQQACTWSLLQRGATGAALDAAHRLVERDPEDIVSQSMLATVLLWSGKFDETLAPIEKALECQPRNGQLWLMKAAALAGRGELEKALVAYRVAMKLDLSSADAQVNLGNLLLAHFDREVDALRAYEEACGLNPRSALAWLGRGQALEALWKLEAAEAAYKEAVRLDPESAYACRALGRLYVDLLWRPADGLEWFERLCELAPKEAAAWNGKGSALEALGRRREAITAYEKALPLAPDELQGLRTTARLHFLQDRFDLALEFANRALAIDSDQTEMLNMRGTILCDRERDYRGALEAFDRAIAVNDRNPSYQFNRGNALFGLGEVRKAIDAFGRAVQLRPGFWNAFNNRANCYGMLREFEKALADYAKAHDLEPRSLRPLYGMVWCHRSLEDQAGARSAAKDFVNCDPRTAHPLQLAWICAVAGDRDRALEAMRRSGQLTSPDALYGVACVYVLLGDVEPALEALEQAVQAGYRRPAGARDDPDFASLGQDPRYRALLERMRGE